MPTNTVELTWLFAAFFSDGTVITQTPDDRSAFDEKRSAFYDVLKAQEDGMRLVSFGIFNEQRVWSVSLLDGHFEVDGISFSPQPVSAPVIPAGGKFDLVFFRDHQQDVIISSDGTTSTGEHRMAYRFGWKYTVQGKSWEQTIVVS